MKVFSDRKLMLPSHDSKMRCVFRENLRGFVQKKRPDSAAKTVSCSHAQKTAVLGRASVIFVDLARTWSVS